MTGSSRAHEKTRRGCLTRQTLVRAIALSISSIPVAAPAPGHDPRRHLMTGSSRAHEKTRRGCLTRPLTRIDRAAAITMTPWLGRRRANVGYHPLIKPERSAARGTRSAPPRAREKTTESRSTRLGRGLTLSRPDRARYPAADSTRARPPTAGCGGHLRQWIKSETSSRRFQSRKSRENTRRRLVPVRCGRNAFSYGSRFALRPQPGGFLIYYTGTDSALSLVPITQDRKGQSYVIDGHQALHRHRGT